MSGLGLFDSSHRIQRKGAKKCENQVTGEEQGMEAERDLNSAPARVLQGKDGRRTDLPTSLPLPTPGHPLSQPLPPSCWDTLCPGSHEEVVSSLLECLSSWRNEKREQIRGALPSKGPGHCRGEAELVQPLEAPVPRIEGSWSPTSYFCDAAHQEGGETF